jgi:hypothetical protein
MQIHAIIMLPVLNAAKVWNLEAGNERDETPVLIEEVIGYG